MTDKKFLIECVDVLFLDEDENGNPTMISKQKYPVLKIVVVNMWIYIFQILER